MPGEFMCLIVLDINLIQVPTYILQHVVEKLLNAGHTFDETEENLI
jgi:hypothetical protein